MLGVDLDLWAWSEDGPLRLRFPAQRSVCFVAHGAELPAALNCDRRALPLSDMEGTPVDALYFRQQTELQRLRELSRDSGLTLCESDIKPADRFLMERFVTAAFVATGQVGQRNGYREMVNPKIRPSELRPKPHYLSLDIETDGIDGEVLSIACSSGEQAFVLMQGEASRWPGGESLQWYPDERALLQGFISLLSQQDPDLLIGWNMINFDLNYLQLRCRQRAVPFRLGRGGELAAILQPQQSGQQRIASIPGRVALDGIDNLRAAFWSFESFALERVASTLR